MLRPLVAVTEVMMPHLTCRRLRQTLWSVNIEQPGNGGLRAVRAVLSLEWRLCRLSQRLSAAPPALCCAGHFNLSISVIINHLQASQE